MDEVMIELRQEPRKGPGVCNRQYPIEQRAMSKETPADDPRQQTDWKSTKQTDKPWKGNPEKEQQRGGPAPDLEEWERSNTH
jgi:hypothetical protein